MPPPPTEFLDRIATTLGGLPGVFSTPQWGGRAYKVAIGSKPKLLAHVMPAKDGAGVTVEFKLPKDRARDAIEQYAWLNPHGFRTLAPAGWVEAKVSRKRQLGPLRKLLEESRSLLPAHEPEPEPEPSRGPRGHDAVARRIDQVMGAAKAEGWEPLDDFEDEEKRRNEKKTSKRRNVETSK